MKKRNTLLKLLLAIVFMFSVICGNVGVNTVMAGGEDVIPNDETGIPDVELYNAILEEADINEDGILTKSEAEAITYLYAVDLGIESIVGISCCKNLDSLELEKNKISDISPLSGLTKMDTLNLENNNITDISVLSGMTEMNYLDLSNNKISDISPLSGLTKMDTLYLGNNNISDISALSGMTDLYTLWLEGNNISNIDALSGMINLSYLKASNNNISDISALSQLINIESITLSSNNISDISALSGLSILRSVSLTNNNISDISVLLEIPSLDSLNIGMNNYIDLNVISQLYNLKMLSMKDSNITDISALAGLTNLEAIYLVKNNISDITVLLNMTNLEIIDIEDNLVSDIETINILKERVGDRLYCDNNLLDVVKEIILDKTSVSLEVEESVTLVATVNPEDGKGKKLSWKSDDENVAVVDENGTITATGYGTTTITATATDKGGVSAICTVIVKKTAHEIKITEGKAYGNDNTEVTHAREGDKVTIKADNAPKGMEFDKWVSENGTITFADERKAETTFDMPAEEVEIRATYKVVSSPDAGDAGDYLKWCALLAVSVLGSMVVLFKRNKEQEN